MTDPQPEDQGGKDDQPVPAAEQPMLSGADDEPPVQGEGAPDSY